MPSLPETEETVFQIRAVYARRCYLRNTRISITNRLGKFLQTQLGWSLSISAKERKAIEAKAQSLVKTAEKIATQKFKADAAARAGKKVRKSKPISTGADYERFELILLATMSAAIPFVVEEGNETAEMVELSKKLPVAPWFRENVFKNGDSLAVIVGEAGNIANYSNKSKLWKRMCVAVIGAGDGKNDIRQGGLRKSASKEDWIAHGYSKTRRSRMYVVGDLLVKGKTVYRTVYLARKAYEIAKAEEQGLKVVPAAKIPKKDAAKYRSQGHIHKRSQRYMEKRLLRDLRLAWLDADREATSSVTKVQILPANLSASYEMA